MGLEQQYHMNVVRKLQEVTRDEVLEAIKKYIAPLVDPLSSVVIVVTPPLKVKETTVGLEELGMEVEKLQYGELPAVCRDESVSGHKKSRKSTLRRWKQLAFSSLKSL